MTGVSPSASVVAQLTERLSITSGVAALTVAVTTGSVFAMILERAFTAVRLPSRASVAVA